MWILFALLPLALAVPLPGTDNEYHDILDLGKKEFRLAFRGNAHIGKSVFDAYKDGTGVSSSLPEACKGLDFSQDCDSHYRQPDVLDNWQNIRDVLFGLVDDSGAIVKTILFNASGTDYMNWFKEDKIVDSCYPDLLRTGKNYFSIMGDDKLDRRFFINQNYGGCQNDKGYVVAIDRPERSCTWETQETLPVFKYSAGLTAKNYQNDIHEVKKAKAIVILVRYLDTAGPSEEYFDMLNTGKKEYRLVFRGTKNVGKPMLPAYETGAGIPTTVEKACKNIDFTAPCTSHYRNTPAMDNWSHVQEVLVGIIHDGAMVKFVRFDGRGSDKLNYFSKERLLDSCWYDLKTENSNYFSIQGHTHEASDKSVQRHFFINRSYGGCENDNGWLVVVDNADQPTKVCAWESTESHVPRILYSPESRTKNYHMNETKDADALVIFLKYDNIPSM